MSMAKLVYMFTALAIMLISAVPMTAEGKISAVYMFGDSTIDVGNNNFLTPCLAKANFPPNGIDFVHSRATGRFSNGLNSADFLAKMMGFDRSPSPFLSLTTTEMFVEVRRGVNLASAGSGILNETGTKFGIVLSFADQIEKFKGGKAKFTEKVTDPNITREWLDSSMFMISMGANDLFEYFTPNSTHAATPISDYIKQLVVGYRANILSLYNLGARRFAVMNVAPIGCCPAIRSLNPTGDCIDDLNKAAQQLNDGVEAVLMVLQLDLPGFLYAVGDTFKIISTIIDDPMLHGLKDVQNACCGSGKMNGEAPCGPKSKLCEKRIDFLYWDMFHPTQTSSKLAAQFFFNGTTNYVRPISFSQLAAI